MYYLIYVSSATNELNEKELELILGTAKAENKKRKITGMLLYKGGNFMQMLEGDKKTVLGLYEIIKHDQRHKNVITILSGEIDKRNFDDWSMGFCNMDKDGSLPEYSEYFDKAILTKDFNDDAQDAYRFIVSFNQWMRE